MASPFFFFLLSISTLPLSVHSIGGFSTDLIHRDSPNSPFYNSSLSSFDRLRTAAHRSTARANYFRTSTLAAPPISNHSSLITSVVIPDSDSFEYLMSLSIGTPPLQILAIADTGSDLIWTQCKPCTDCFEQINQIYDPKSSSSYNTISCKDNICSDLPQPSCSSISACQYTYSYGGGSHTEGTLSLETFTFDSDSEQKIPIPKILFGCSHVSNGTFHESEDGLVGLGGGPLSLVSQLGSSIEHKFSYCLVPHSDMSSSSVLNFGDKAEVIGPNTVTTPIIAGDPDTFYYLSLEAISIGGDKIFAGDGEIVIDSGTTLTILDDSMMQPLIDKVSELVNYPQVIDSDGVFDLCFDVSMLSGTDPELPELTFEFSGAAVKLPPMNTFVESNEGVVCLAIVSSGGGLQIFGNIAQQNWHIGYDLGARKLSLAPADCAEFLVTKTLSVSEGYVTRLCWLCCVWAVGLLCVFFAESLF